MIATATICIMNNAHFPLAAISLAVGAVGAMFSIGQIFIRPQMGAQITDWTQQRLVFFPQMFPIVRRKKRNYKSLSRAAHQDPEPRSRRYVS
jgi:hypothetical protein